MKELLLKVKTATLVNGVAAVSKNGVGLTAKSIFAQKAEMNGKR